MPKKYQPRAGAREAVAEAHSILPKWFGIKDAAHYSGLSKSLIELLVRDGHVTSSNVVRPGTSRGRRLILRESLDAWIEAGIERSPSALAMNTQGNGGAA